MSIKRSIDEYIRHLEESTSIADCDLIPAEERIDEQDFLFISYSHSDYKKVFADLAVMEQAGIHFWYDEGLVAGNNWDEEVRKKLLSPHCRGVIFFISENLFLSRSVNQEIDLVCGKGTNYEKPFFSVNLTQKLPAMILRSIMRMDDEVLERAALDMDRIGALANAFGDRRTYLPFSDLNHRQQLENTVKKQFPSVIHRKNDAAAEKVYYLLHEINGETIPLKDEICLFGRDAQLNYRIKDSAVSRCHFSIVNLMNRSLLVDYGALNGTFLNGTKVNPENPVFLQDGDIIKAGHQLFTYHSK